MIVILDCGSQLTHNIARRVREQKVYCEIIPYHKPFDRSDGLEGIIISGSPASVHDEEAPLFSTEIFDRGVPVLGICYGMQSTSYLLDGQVEHGDKREYGRMKLSIVKDNHLFKDVPNESIVWMSHGDRVLSMPEGFEALATSENAPIASMYHPGKDIYGVQFHVEVDHTEHGRKILSNFLDVCGCQRDWTAESFIEQTVRDIRDIVGEGMAIGGVSGGVDSTVASVLMHRAIGERYIPIFVNNGLLRKDEPEEVIDTFERIMGIKLNYVDATDRFLDKLIGVTDPEMKRKIIGNEFIYVFQEEAKKYGSLGFLMQGTLYPDVIESVSVFGGPTSTIKSHHNVGGLPKEMNLKLIEPLRYLFKDEVRSVGEQLGLPKYVVWRQPFPGPGEALRIKGAVTREKLSMVREADAIFIDELKKNNLYYDGHTWQAFAILSGDQTVGVMGDERTYQYPIVLRAVTSNDGMTADWARLQFDLQAVLSNRIVNEVKGVNRVTIDITSKPPGTIEWE
jgi:GMP synthase (glutamine-hydrolysing)